MSDLCWVCEKNSTAIMRASNRPESEKSEVITEYLLHLKQLNYIGDQGCRGTSNPSYTREIVLPHTVQGM